MSSELKACSCGRPARFIDEYNDGEHLWVECSGSTEESCGLRTQCYDTKEDAIEAWNLAMSRRTSSPAVLALVEACKRMVEHVNERWPEGFTCGCCDCAKCWELSDAAAAESALAAVEREIGNA